MKEEPRILWWKGAGVSCPALSLTNYTSLTFQPWTGSRTEVTQPWAVPVIAGWGGRGDQKRGTGGQSRSDFTLGVIQDKATGKSSSGSPKMEKSPDSPLSSAPCCLRNKLTWFAKLLTIWSHTLASLQAKLSHTFQSICVELFSGLQKCQFPFSPQVFAHAVSCCLEWTAPHSSAWRTSAHSLRQHKCHLLWGVSLALLLLVTFSVPTAFWS